MPSRVADYVLVSGLDVGKIKPNPDARSITDVKIQATLLDKIPEAEHKDTKFPANISMFCFPMGLSLAEKAKNTDQFNFILTDVRGTRSYCSALVFYEQLEDSLVKRIYQKLCDVSGPTKSPKGGEGKDAAPSQGEGAQMMPSINRMRSVSKMVVPAGPLFAPKCICIVSQYPFMKQMEQFLRELHTKMTNSFFDTPIERVVANLIFEVPLPPRGRARVQYSSLITPMFFSRPPPNKMPMKHFDLIGMFRLLSVDNIIMIFSAVMNERRLLFTSDKLQDLMVVMESLCYLIFPLRWRHIYVPLLPEVLNDRVCAPFPYIIGMHTACKPDQLLLEGVIVVDLIKNTISTTSGADPLLPLHDKMHARLMKTLRKVTPDPSQPLGPGTKWPRNHDDEIVQTFLRFFVKLFKDYKKHLRATSEDVDEKFDKEGFLESHSENCDWLEGVMETQMFQCFVDERC